MPRKSTDDDRPADGRMVPDADARRAVEVIRAIMTNPTGSREEAAQLNAAKAMKSLHDAERRFSAARVAELARLPNASRNVTDLATMTQERLAELRAEMNADFPGKPPAA